jgi:small subunit ribosomal protein S21
MLIINTDKGIESALKVYKSKVRNTKQVELLREREAFVKPSVKRREEILSAKWKESKRIR